MNLLSKSDVFAENKLFATLDTTVRKVVFGNVPFLLSDTVGFIRKLPHHLIESFKSTLDEVRESDILLHVADIDHKSFENQIIAVNETLKELGAHDKTTLLVFNKMDLYREHNFDQLLDQETKYEIEKELRHRLKNQFTSDNIFISATIKENIEELWEKLITLVKREYQIRWPFEVRNW
jgi:GTP-binding protein HflX